MSKVQPYVKSTTLLSKVQSYCQNLFSKVQLFCQNIQLYVKIATVNLLLVEKNSITSRSTISVVSSQTVRTSSKQKSLSTTTLTARVTGVISSANAGTQTWIDNRWGQFMSYFWEIVLLYFWFKFVVRWTSTVIEN